MRALQEGNALFSSARRSPSAEYSMVQPTKLSGITENYLMIGT